MTCDRCGNEIPSGMMFCPKCGRAVQMVPDFDVNIDEGIVVSSDEVKEALDKLIDSEGNRRLSDDTVRLPAIKGEVSMFRRAAAITSFAILLVILILVVVFVLRSNGNSLSNILEEARSAYGEGDYENAVEGFEKALIKAKEDETLIEINDQISLADALNKTGRSDDAESVLRGIIVLDPENYLAYEQLINIYKDQGKYDDINKLIAGAVDDSVYSRFKGYMTVPPDFDVAAGSYDEEFDLSLSSEFDGEIYYTLDGSSPDSSSELYMEPLHIGEGDTVVTAVCINGYDMKSPEVSMKYSVRFELPPDPVIDPDSGNFSQPKYISIETPENDGSRLYYTLDGSEPTEDSALYEHIIPMPLGKQTLKARAVSVKGVSGNVVEKEYSLNVKGVCSSADATNYVAASLVATGNLIDIYGNKAGVKGHFKYLCTRAAKEGSRTYYIIDEYLEDQNGILTETGTAYAVDIISCMMYRANMKPDGRYGFTLFY
ncbi:MAG: chitobiase/beta-hexosaminidase C-terminal domain-containing protein [Lachnospiraceae bacterium]|nr:chitobiase/beta-hexosaminidase C-terminal domain-containing protein [Lachnospiraceae bacterium]